MFFWCTDPEGVIKILCSDVRIRSISEILWFSDIRILKGVADVSILNMSLKYSMVF